MALSRFDLFHGHLFVARHARALGILFHAAEYPAQSQSFPVELGFCQLHSPQKFDQEAMDYRNWIYFKVRYSKTINCRHDDFTEELKHQQSIRQVVFSVPSKGGFVIM